MKKLLGLLLCVVLVFEMTACSGSDNSDTGNNSGTEAGSGSISAKTDGFAFESNGVTLYIDAEAAELVEALGEPISYYEAASCAFDGLDKTYTYSGFTLDTYPDENGVDRVSDIIITDDTITTPEGAYLGMTSDEVAALFTETATDDNGSLVYEKNGMKLTFVITDGTVTSIQYFTKVLD